MRVPAGFFAALLLLACRGGNAPERPVWIDRHERAMGARLSIELEAPDLHAAGVASDAGLSAVGAADGLLSNRRADSRAAVLNRSPVGALVPIDSALCRVFAEVTGIASATPDVFEPAIGALISAWDLDGAGRVPSVVELAAARRASGPGGVTMDLDHCTVQRLAGAASIETGGFALGYALRAVRDSLLRHGVHSARVDFGGQVVVFGPTKSGGPWRVSIASAEDREAEVFAIWLADGSASTSSQSERYVRAAGQNIGYILDPRTGTPAPAWGSLTVVAQDPLRADILSTALFVLGPDSALAWGSRHPEVGVLVLDRRDGAIRPRWNNGLRPALDSATATPIR
jgi:thiamine biosynthesis lipoprotein